MKNETESPLELAVRVIPGASRNEVTGVIDGVWKVRLSAAPVDGKANRALVEYLADKLDINRSQVTLLKGTFGRSKSVAVYGLSQEQIDQRLSK